MQEWLSKTIRFLKGVGPNKAAKLAKLNIFTIKDLLEHYPHRYEDRSSLCRISELVSGSHQSFTGTVCSIESYSTRGPHITKVLVSDSTGTAELVWFGQPNRKKQYKPGLKLSVYGKIKRCFGKVQVENADVEIYESQTGFQFTILPVYSTCDNLSQNLLRSVVKQVLAETLAMPDLLPQELCAKYDLLPRFEAVKQIHFPQDFSILAAARRTLVFEELFLLHYALAAYKRQTKRSCQGIKHNADGSLLKQAGQLLPFALTADQQKTLGEIKADMEDVTPMQRLLQGDVGSGKTVIAALALIKTVENGYQGAMMAPTEILAEQHFNTLIGVFSPLGIRLGMLTGKLTRKQREETLRLLKEGLLDVVIGTHALIQDGVEFFKLGLVVTDEQHRFGVSQRAKLQDKGIMPDVLVMTATPIPRTMALTVYGDLDVSIIRLMPPGRKPVRTFARGAERRELIYKFVIDEVRKGRQAYVVCPLVAESEKIAIQSAVGMFEKLTNSFLKDISCGLVHGRLKPNKKNSIMNSFYSGALQVLVATTVIEVGVNVPNASVMVIEGADRFGLAQLHQLRGRVGRGSRQAYCILLHEGSTADIPERLKLMTEITDGFELAEKDLIMRGPGQFFGTRQHGMLYFKIANILTDVDILLAARTEVQASINDRQLFRQIIPVVQERYRAHFDNIRN